MRIYKPVEFVFCHQLWLEYDLMPWHEAYWEHHRAILLLFLYPIVSPYEMTVNGLLPISKASVFYPKEYRIQVFRNNLNKEFKINYLLRTLVAQLTRPYILTRVINMRWKACSIGMRNNRMCCYQSFYNYVMNLLP